MFTLSCLHPFSFFDLPFKLGSNFSIHLELITFLLGGKSTSSQLSFFEIESILSLMVHIHYRLWTTLVKFTIFVVWIGTIMKLLVKRYWLWWEFTRWWCWVIINKRVHMWWKLMKVLWTWGLLMETKST